MSQHLTAIIRAEGDTYVALCPELDVASQGDSIQEARDNLREAIKLFLDCASEDEIELRSLGELFVTQLEVELG